MCAITCTYCTDETPCLKWGFTRKSTPLCQAVVPGRPEWEFSISFFDETTVVQGSLFLVIFSDLLHLRLVDEVHQIVNITTGTRESLTLCSAIRLEEKPCLQDSCKEELC